MKSFSFFFFPREKKMIRCFIFFFVRISLTFETIPRYTNKIENGRLTFDFSFEKREKKISSKIRRTFNTPLIHSKRILRETVINHHLERNRFLSFSFRERKKWFVASLFFFRYFRNKQNRKWKINLRFFFRKKKISSKIRHCNI